jgi:chromosome segregation ATPase
MHSSTYQSALAGIEAQMQLLFNDEGQADEVYALLEELGVILQVDIPDMLNRSTDRPKAFDAYIAGLTDVGQRAQSQLEQLTQELDEIQNERRDKRRIASDIEKDLNKALREQDYSAASGLQQQIIEAEAEVTRIESEEDQQKSIIKLYEDLLQVADERLQAMNANREALLEGVSVVEVPGVEGLDLIEQEQGGRRNHSIFEEGLQGL